MIFYYIKPIHFLTRSILFIVKEDDCYPSNYSIESPILIFAAPDKPLVWPVGGQVVFNQESTQGQSFNCLQIYLSLLRPKAEVWWHDIVGYSQIMVFLCKKDFQLCYLLPIMIVYPHSSRKTIIKFFSWKPSLGANYFFIFKIFPW